MDDARASSSSQRENDAEAARLYREAAMALQPLDPGHAISEITPFETPVRGKTAAARIAENSEEQQQARGTRCGRHPPERNCGMVSKGTLLRLVVSLAAFASLASLAGGYFDGH